MNELPKLKITFSVEGRTTIHRNRYIAYMTGFLKQRGFKVIRNKDDEGKQWIEAEEAKNE